MWTFPDSRTFLIFSESPASKLYTQSIISKFFSHEGSIQNFNVPLPLCVTKFMKMKSADPSVYKKTWKKLKTSAVKSRYRHINAKFIRSHTEVNKYFDNALFDVTPANNPKRKKKYGGVFSLPDKTDYYLRITLDNNRAKIVVSSSASSSQYADWIVQYLSFLLTV